jgi:hypothetical protein
MAREIVVTRINTQKTSVATVGPQGFQGNQGNQGDFGGATFAYDFNTSTSSADPGAGKLALNNETFSSATQLYIDDLDIDGTDIQLYLRTIDDSTSTIKGHFRISKRLSPDDFVLYTITSLAEDSGYFTVSCSYVSGSSPTFANNEDLLITFARTGDKGEQGPQGFQGFQGNQGNQGYQGYQGFQGDQGVVKSATAPGDTSLLWFDTTTSGVNGIQGPQGSQGSQGNQGFQGAQGNQGNQGNQGLQGEQGIPSLDTGFKNQIMNGDFRINQRGFTSSTLNGIYGHDRWQTLFNGGTITYSTQAFSVGTQVGEYQPQNFARVVTSGMSGVSDNAILRQSIEDVRTFAGATVTVSFYAKAATSTLAAPAKMAIELGQFFGAGGSPSADVYTYAGQATLSTSWQRYSVTVALPSISGKTIGTTANTSALQLFLWQSAGSAWNARTGTLGIQSNTFDIWGVQVERGGYATSFEERPLQAELAMCQRYYHSTNSGVSQVPGNTGIGVNTTRINSQVKFAQEMRVTPQVVIYNYNNSANQVSGFTAADNLGTNVTPIVEQFGPRGWIGLSSTTGNFVLGNHYWYWYTANAEF